MPKLIEHTPEEIARARHLYEGTSVPVRDIAKLMGLGLSTFVRRTRLWGWTPRNRYLADLDAAAKANVPIEEIREVAAPVVKFAEKLSLVDRVRAAVESEIVAIESVLHRVEAAQLRSTDAERAARTLATLVRTLKELAALELPPRDDANDETDSEDDFRDLEEFRRSLTERLDRLRERGEAG